MFGQMRPKHNFIKETQPTLFFSISFYRFFLYCLTPDCLYELIKYIFKESISVQPPRRRELLLYYNRHSFRGMQRLIWFEWSPLFSANCVTLLKVVFSVLLHSMGIKFNCIKSSLNNLCQVSGGRYFFSGVRNKC